MPHLLLKDARPITASIIDTDLHQVQKIHILFHLLREHYVRGYSSSKQRNSFRDYAGAQQQEQEMIHMRKEIIMCPC